MVDSNTPVVRQLEEVKAKLKADNVQIMRGDALAVAQSAATRGQRYDLIFLDPPYQQDFLARALPLCAKLLKEGGLVYAESGMSLEFDAAAAQQQDAPPDWMAPWEVIRADKAGMVFYHLLKYKEMAA
jgi:16S rRNA G966 N2-methylase RsmD